MLSFSSFQVLVVVVMYVWYVVSLSACVVFVFASVSFMYVARCVVFPGCVWLLFLLLLCSLCIVLRLCFPIVGFCCIVAILLCLVLLCLWLCLLCMSSFLPILCCCVLLSRWLRGSLVLVWFGCWRVLVCMWCFR